MASGKSIEILGIDEEELLKTYKISSLKLKRWEEVDPTSNNNHSQDSRPAGISTPNSTKFSSKGEDDPLGLVRGPILTDVSGELRASASTTSKTFDPKAFLSIVHPNASFSDLKKGGARLRESLEQRSEALKVLVESEFDRFVAVKVVNEVVYEQMKEGPLRPQGDYATAELKESIGLAASKADQVFAPLIENRKKAERLRSTLGVFERSKFFFNLAGTLIEAIEAEKYDTFLLAYKRGKNMLDTKPGQVLNLPPPSNPEEQAQHQRIFDKIWLEVEKVVKDFKLKMLNELGAANNDAPKPVEEIEKAIEIILELDPTSDPAWAFLEKQHQLIIDKLVSLFNATVNKTRTIITQANDQSFSEDQLADDLRSSLVVIDSAITIDSGAALGPTIGSEVWSAILELIRIPSEFLSKELAVYWHIANGYLHGKYGRPDGKIVKDLKTRRIIPCKQMINQIILRYCALLSGFFGLSSDPNSPSLHLPITDLPDFAPQYANSIQVAFYLRKAINLLTEWVHEIINLKIPQESIVFLDEFLESAGFKLLSTLATYWVKDAKIFHQLEDWVQPKQIEDDAEPVVTTLYLKRIYNFQRYMMLNSFSLAGGKEKTGLAIFGNQSLDDQPNGSNSKANRQQTISAMSSKKAQAAFLDGLYGFLDGLVHIAVSSPKPQQVSPTQVQTSSIEFSTSFFMTADVTDENENQLIESDESLDVRLLLTISNLSNLAKIYIPKLFRQFSQAFSVDMSSEVETLADVIAQLDGLLMGDYIKRKAEIIQEIIHIGVLGGKIDWLNAPVPTGVNSFVYDALLILVLVHSQMSSIVGPTPSSQIDGEPLIKIVLSKLVEGLAEACLKAFGSVEKFGMGGMLQATLEIEFIHRTLSAYITPIADESMQGIYQKITTAYQRSPKLNEREEANKELQNELENLKKTLHLSRRTTALAFVCFKKIKPDNHNNNLSSSVNSNVGSVQDSNHHHHHHRHHHNQSSS